jgi:hypothetical protein
MEDFALRMERRLTRVETLLGVVLVLQGLNAVVTLLL